MRGRRGVEWWEGSGGRGRGGCGRGELLLEKFTVLCILSLPPSLPQVAPHQVKLVVSGNIQQFRGSLPVRCVPPSLCTCRI